MLGGKLEGGALRVGSRVALVPGPQGAFTVRSIEVRGWPRVKEIGGRGLVQVGKAASQRSAPGVLAPAPNAAASRLHVFNLTCPLAYLSAPGPAPPAHLCPPFVSQYPLLGKQTGACPLP